MKAIWNGSINFGLVNIPVVAFSAVREEKVSFRQLRQGDLSLIKYKKVAEVDGKEVPADQIVRGFEYEKKRFVVLTDEELTEVNLESTKTITLEEFVPLEQLGVRMYEKPYVLEAGKAALLPYSLLYKALTDMNRVGIGKVALRNREYLVAIMPQDGRLLMLQLRFANEILNVDEITQANPEVDKMQLQMAKKLIEAMSKPKFNLGNYQNKYFEALQNLIQDKLSKPTAQKKTKKAVAKQDTMPDMVKILQASINATTKGKKAA